MGTDLFVKIQYGGQTSAYATEAATTSEIGKVQGFTPINENGLVLERGIGDGRDVSNTLYGPYTCGGSLSWHVHDFAFLKHWVGFQDGSGTAGSPYKLNEVDDVSLSSSAGLQVFSLEVNHLEGSTDDVDTYIGCVGNSFSLSGSIGEPVSASGDFVARHVVSSTTGTAYTPVTTNPWMMYQGTWSFGSSPSALTGIQSFSVGYTNNLVIERDAGSRFISQPLTGPRDYSWSLVIKSTASVNSSLRDNFYGQANTPVDGVSSASPTADIEFKIALSEGSSSTNRNATIWFDQASITSIGKAVNLGQGLVIYSVSGVAKSAKDNAFIKWWTVS